MSTSTEKSAALVKANNQTPFSERVLPDLDFPSVQDFVSLSPQPDKHKTLAISEFYVRKLCARPEFLKSRTEDRYDVEFDLLEPHKIPPSYPAKLIDEVLEAALRS